MKIIIGSDHAGFELKEDIKEYLSDSTIYEITDMGTFSSDISVDYPDIADKVCTNINKYNYGILICGTGIGISMRANRYNSIRCALCHNLQTAKLSRKHNNANILALGARILNIEDVKKIVTTFLYTQFEGGRHQRRINKL